MGRFAEENALIDSHVGLSVDVDEDDAPTLRFLLPGGDELPLKVEVSRLLYQLDRDAYVEALNAARGAVESLEYEEQGGEDEADSYHQVEAASFS